MQYICMFIMMFAGVDDSQVPGQQHPHQGEHQTVLQPQHAEHLRSRYPEPTEPDHLQGEEDRTEEISEAAAGEIRENTSYRVTNGATLVGLLVLPDPGHHVVR